MKPLPHRYNVTLTSGEQSYPVLTSDRLEPFTSAPPENFDGPGNLWSPETLLVAAVADCFALTFRAIAKASQQTGVNRKRFSDTSGRCWQKSRCWRV